MQNEIKTPVNGIDISIEDSNTRGTPVVFVHPFPFNRSIWQNQIEFFKSTNRIITYDIRGFGNSTLDTKKSTIALYADDLIQLLDNLKITQVVACGLSMGGYILLNAMERYASKFKAVILCDTQCLADSKEEQQKRYETIKEIEEKGLNDFAEGFVTRAFSVYTLENNKELVEKMKNVILSNSTAAITSGLAAMAQREQTCSGLKQVSIPTLVISGKNDTVIQPSQSEFLFNNIPGAKLEFIEKAGHLVNIEQAKAFNDIVYKFISTLK